MAARSIGGALGAAILAVAIAACGAPVPAESAARSASRAASLSAPAPDRVVDLPAKLHEASGLAVTADGRVLSHNDEHAVVREIDPATGAIVKSFHVGDLKGDFEDIAVAGDGAIWLLDSNGVLLRFMEGADGAQAPFETVDTGLKDTCELEGLAWRATSRSLILACKVMHARAMRDRVELYEWSIEGRRLTPLLNLPMASLAAAAGVAAFHPSAVQIDPASGRIVLLAGREQALVELDPAGAVLAGRRFGAEHPQPEGLAILPDGALLIADEGPKKHIPARLTRYARTP